MYDLRGILFLALVAAEKLEEIEKRETKTSSGTRKNIKHQSPPDDHQSKLISSEIRSFQSMAVSLTADLKELRVDVPEPPPDITPLAKELSEVIVADREQQEPSPPPIIETTLRPTASCKCRNLNDLSRVLIYSLFLVSEMITDRLERLNRVEMELLKRPEVKNEMEQALVDAITSHAMWEQMRQKQQTKQSTVGDSQWSE